MSHVPFIQLKTRVRMPTRRDRPGLAGLRSHSEGVMQVRGAAPAARGGEDLFCDCLAALREGTSL